MDTNSNTPAPSVEYVRRGYPKVTACPRCRSNVYMTVEAEPRYLCEGACGWYWVPTIEDHLNADLLACERALAAARAEIERLKTEGSPGVMHAVDQAFYDLTVKDRNAAQAERDTLKAANDALHSTLDSARQAVEIQGRGLRELRQSLANSREELRSARQALRELTAIYEIVELDNGPYLSRRVLGEHSLTGPITPATAAELVRAKEAGRG